MGRASATSYARRVLHIRLRPSRIDRLEVSRLLGELGKIGSNINQIAHHLNSGLPGDRVTDSLEYALRDLAECACPSFKPSASSRTASTNEAEFPEW